MASVVRDSSGPLSIDIGNLAARLNVIKSEFQDKRVIRRTHILEIGNILNTWLSHTHSYHDQLFIAYGDRAPQPSSSQTIFVSNVWDEYLANTDNLNNLSLAKANEIVAWLINQLNYHKNHSHLWYIQPDPPPAYYQFTPSGNRPDYSTVQACSYGNGYIWPYGKIGSEYSVGWVGTKLNPGNESVVRVQFAVDDTADVYLNGNLVYRAGISGTYDFNVNVNTNSDNYFSFYVSDAVGGKRRLEVLISRTSDNNVLRAVYPVEDWESS